jgi:hypothetical protein
LYINLSNSSELYDWVSTINLVAAMFSSPPLPGGIGSNKTFQRPLLPVAKTRYSLQEQFEYHKKHVKLLQSDLTKLESVNGASHLHLKEEKQFDKDKYDYLQFEVKYVYLFVFKVLFIFKFFQRFNDTHCTLTC